MPRMAFRTRKRSCLIHIWDTSQVTEFMIAFREMIERHIATKSMRLSRLSIKRSTLKSAEAHWSTKTDSFEPTLDDESKPQIYRQIGIDFVDRWRAGSP